MKLFIHSHSIVLYLGAIVAFGSLCGQPALTLAQENNEAAYPDIYEDLGNGTVKNINTGLVWLKDPTNIPRATSIDEAQAKVSELKSGVHGLKDGSTAGNWRLPTPSEAGGPLPWTKAMRSGQYPPLASKGGGAGVVVTFKNVDTEPVTVTWVDFDGKLSAGDPTIIQPGQSLDVNSFDGHVFVFKKGGEQIRVVTTTDKPQQEFEIREEDYTIYARGYVSFDDEREDFKDLTFWGPSQNGDDSGGFDSTSWSRQNQGYLWPVRDSVVGDEDDNNPVVKTFKDGPYKGCVESITGLNIEGTVCDVKFIFDKTFNEVFVKGETARTPVCWDNIAAAESASNAIKECLAAKKIAGPATDAAAVKDWTGTDAIEYLLPVRGFNEWGGGPPWQYVTATSIWFDYGEASVYNEETNEWVDNVNRVKEWKRANDRNVLTADKYPRYAYAVFTISKDK